MTGINGQLISLLLQLHLDTQIICIIVLIKVLNLMRNQYKKEWNSILITGSHFHTG